MVQVPFSVASGHVDVQLEIGPFLVRVRSDVPGFENHLQRFYLEYPRHAPDDGHFDVAVAATRGLRRWVRPQATLVANGTVPFYPLPAPLAGPLMEWGLNWCIGTRSHQWVVVHSAVVERGGRAIILPAPPGSGKSTLCAALMYAGWRLFSDEFALIDPETRRIFPAPRPVSLKNASIELIGKRHADAVFSPEAVDIEGARFVHAKPTSDSIQRAREGATPGWIILPRYVAGAATTIEPLPKAQALIQLADESFNYNFLGLTGFNCLVELVRETQCYRLEYSDLDDVLERLTRLTDR